MSRNESNISAIIASTPNFSDQIDAIAVAREWFRPGIHGWPTKTVIEDYLSDKTTVHEAVEQLARPIEEAYTKALRGRPSKPDSSDASAGCGLWDLWYGVLHAARQSPWDDSNGRQGKLLRLVQTFKTRPDPETAGKLTERLKNDWVYKDGKLWTVLKLLGPSASESWNDSPGCGAGTTLLEIKAWLNVSACVARLSKSATFDFCLYAVWEFRDALEGSTTGVVDRDGVRIDLQTTLVWLKVAGKEMWEKCCQGEPMEEMPPDLDPRNKNCQWYGSSELSRARWHCWGRRFGVITESKSAKW